MHNGHRNAGVVFFKHAAWNPFPQHNHRLISVLSWISVDKDSLLKYNGSEHLLQLRPLFASASMLSVWVLVLGGSLLFFQVHRRGKSSKSLQIEQNCGKTKRHDCRLTVLPVVSSTMHVRPLTLFCFSFFPFFLFSLFFLFLCSFVQNR